MMILVTGGAGYIGAHMALTLTQAGHEVVVLDNLSTGYRAAVKWGALEEASTGDAGRLDAVFASRRFDAVMHFAAKSLVGESVKEPLSYYRNNVADMIVLLDAMRRAWVGHLRSGRRKPRYTHCRPAGRSRAR